MGVRFVRSKNVTSFSRTVSHEYEIGCACRMFLNGSYKRPSHVILHRTKKLKECNLDNFLGFIAISAIAE